MADRGSTPRSGLHTVLVRKALCDQLKRLFLDQGLALYSNDRYSSANETYCGAEGIGKV